MQSSPTPDGAPPADLPPGLLGRAYSIVAGIPLGVLAISVSFWMLDYDDYVWFGALLGVGGALLVPIVERRIRAVQLPSPKPLTTLGGLLGLILLAQLLLGIGGIGGGELMAFVMVLLLGGPLFGAMIGALLDYACENASKGAWLSPIAILIGVTIAAIVPVVLIASHAEPDPKDVTRDTLVLIATDWQSDPKMRHAKIENVSLQPRGHRTYTGIAEVTVHGQRRRFDVEVYVRHGDVRAKWTARNN